MDLAFGRKQTPRSPPIVTLIETRMSAFGTKSVPAFGPSTTVIRKRERPSIDIGALFQPETEWTHCASHRATRQQHGGGDCLSSDYRISPPCRCELRASGGRNNFTVQSVPTPDATEKFTYDADKVASPAAAHRQALRKNRGQYRDHPVLRACGASTCACTQRGSAPLVQ